MTFARLLAKQLGNPSGIFGLVLAPLWNKRNAVLNEFTFDSLVLNPHDRVLEVGFGGGYLLGRMSRVVTDGFLAGVDVSPAMVAFCEKRYRSLIKSGKLEIKCTCAESLPYPPDYFTKACTVNSIFYWQNASQAISELWRVLETRGMLVMCFTCRESLENKEFTKHSVTLYKADDVYQMMALSGFHEIRMNRASDRHREFLCAIGRK
jgi:ubiquinone/menaquinone biosynthesis C-methylase UbiE